LAESRDLFERWPSLALEEKRGIVEAIVERIQIGKEEVEIDLSSFRDSALSHGKTATKPHGFIAATTSARAG
jgi:hypothetical protein